jgi:hypothetical protein
MSVDTPPSVNSRPPIGTGGKTPAIELLASSASSACPRVSVTACPVAASVATTATGMRVSSSRLVASGRRVRSER